MTIGEIAASIKPGQNYIPTKPMKEYENFLNLEVVWKDEHMLELEVAVTNNGYSGVARGYDTGEHLQM